MPLTMSSIIDPIGSINIKPFISTTPFVNHTSLMRLSSLTTTTWLMICLTYGNLNFFTVNTTGTSRQLPIANKIPNHQK
jgi:hypothetical protein